LRRHGFGHHTVDRVNHDRETAMKLGISPSDLHIKQNPPVRSLAGVATTIGIDVKLYGELADEVDTVNRALPQDLGGIPLSELELERRSIRCSTLF